MIFILLFLGRFQVHELRILYGHELAELIVGTDTGLDDDALNVTADVVECHEVGGVHHRQRQCVVGVGDRDDLVLDKDVLGNEPDDARIEVDVFRQADKLDADLLVGFLQPFGEDPGQPQGNLGVQRQEVSEVRACQRVDRGRLDGVDACRARFARQQGHFADRVARAKLSYEEIDAGDRVLLPDLDQTVLNDVHGDAGCALAHDRLRWGELVCFQTGPQLRQALLGKVREKADVLQEANQLIGFGYCCRHRAEMSYSNSCSLFSGRFRSQRWQCPAAGGICGQ